MIDFAALKTLLAEVVRDVVREELERARGAQRSLSKPELATALGVSTATIDRHVRNGMPFQQSGARRVFDLDSCRAWLRDRPRAAPGEATEDVETMGVVRKTRRAA